MVWRGQTVVNLGLPERRRAAQPRSGSMRETVSTQPPLERTSQNGGTVSGKSCDCHLSFCLVFAWLMATILITSCWQLSEPFVGACESSQLGGYCAIQRYPAVVLSKCRGPGLCARNSQTGLLGGYLNRLVASRCLLCAAGASLVGRRACSTPFSTVIASNACRLVGCPGTRGAPCQPDAGDQDAR